MFHLLGLTRLFSEKAKKVNDFHNRLEARIEEEFRGVEFPSHFVLRTEQNKRNELTLRLDQYIEARKAAREISTQLKKGTGFASLPMSHQDMLVALDMNSEYRRTRDSIATTSTKLRTESVINHYNL